MPDDTVMPFSSVKVSAKTICFLCCIAAAGIFLFSISNAGGSRRPVPGTEEGPAHVSPSRQVKNVSSDDAAASRSFSPYSLLNRFR